MFEDEEDVEKCGFEPQKIIEKCDFEVIQMNDGMCDGCGRRIPTDSEMYFVHTDYGEECYCEKCAIEYVRAEKTDAEILDKLFVHRTVGCDG